MKLHTENLTILFVDIVGYTATTSRQSRTENADLLKTFNRTLLPLVQRFDGKLVKSIGDAMLLTFRSPTDAMLCSMALQDAMHNYNLHIAQADPIHIRVAANLGEVRVTKNDIFGEPVNLAARIEGVAPADEIYLSEAVYMAMNKAEVPACEVGEFTLAGVSKPVRLYNIPRFATHRLVPQDASSAETGDDLLFPYGGMHVSEGRAQHQRTQSQRQRLLLGALATVAALSIAAGGWLYKQHASSAPTETAPSTTAGATTVNTPPIPNNEISTSTEKQTTNENSAQAIPAEKKSIPPQTTTAKPVAKPSTPPRRFSTISDAKRAYRERRLSREEYRRAVTPLENSYENRIRNLKQEYRAGRLTREQYRNSARSAEQNYYGN